MPGLLEGKRGLVMGVANDRSIAWGIAKALAAQGAELAFTYQGEAFGKRVQPLAESLYRMLWSWLLCVLVTVVVSLLTRPMPYDSLSGLVYGCTILPEQTTYPLVQRPVFWAAASLFVFFWLQWLFR